MAVICFFGFGNLYAQRVNLSMAMVCMINHTATDVGMELEYPVQYYSHIGHTNDSGYSHVTTRGPLDLKEQCPSHGHSDNETISQSEVGMWARFFHH